MTRHDLLIGISSGGSRLSTAASFPYFLENGERMGMGREKKGCLIHDRRGKGRVCSSCPKRCWQLLLTTPSWAGRAAGLGDGLLIIRAASLGTFLGMEK